MRVVICLAPWHPILRDVPPSVPFQLKREGRTTVPFFLVALSRGKYCSQPFFERTSCCHMYLIIVPGFPETMSETFHVQCRHSAADGHDHQQLLFQRGNPSPPPDFEFLRCPRQDQVQVHHRSREDGGSTQFHQDHS